MRKPYALEKKDVIKTIVILLALSLITRVFITIGYAGTVVFKDDFEDGNAADWQLEPGWQVINDAGNYVLSGSGHSFARAGDIGWSVYTFMVKVKLIESESATHLNYRNFNCDRYFIHLNSNELRLGKTQPCGTHTDLVNLPALHALGEWHELKVVGQQGNIKVYVNGGLKIDYTDSDPVIAGPISLENLAEAAVYYDDIVVTIIEHLASTKWETTGGPLGGLGYDVRIHPLNSQIMYVTDNFAGVVKSENAGQAWVQTNQGISIRSGTTGDAVNIFSLTIDPNNPNIIWAGTFGEGASFGVFRSTDGGNSWSLKNKGISLDSDINLVFRGFAIQPGNSNIVYAQAEVPTNIDGWEFNRVKGRLYKTIDGGESWNLIWGGDNLCRYLVIHPENNEILYLSTGIFDREAYNSDCESGNAGGVGVLKSVDGGQTWSSVNVGLTDLYVGCLRMHPSNPQILFAATGNNACSGGYQGEVGSGLFRTANGGTTWDVVIENDIMTTVNFSPSNPNIVYAGSANAFYRSSNGGLTWNRYAKPDGGGYGPPGVRAGVPIDVVVDPENPDIVYVNNYGGGVFRSVDGTQTWMEWSKGYSGAELHDVFIPSDKPAMVLTIGRSGPFNSANYGTGWRGIANGAAILAEWYAIVAQPGNADMILVSDEHQGVIFRSTDGGDNFDAVLRHPQTNGNDPNRRQGFKTIVFAQSDPNIVYAGLAKDRLTIGSSIPFGTVIYKSSNAGLTFAPLPSNLDGTNVNQLIVSPTNSNHVYAATSTGMYKSTDGAVSWSRLNGLGERFVEALAIIFKKPEYYVAGERFGGIWISADSGASWSGPHNTGFNSPNPWITALAVDPKNAFVIFAADLYSGIYRSTNKGISWSPFPDWKMSGLAVRSVSDIAVNHEVIYAATQGGGVYRYFRSAAPPISSTLMLLLLNE